MLKPSYTSAPILAHFDVTSPSIIETDASDFTVGAIQSKTQKNGWVYAVAFLSQTFSPEEMNYDIYDKEIADIVLAILK